MAKDTITEEEKEKANQTFKSFTEKNYTQEQLQGDYDTVMQNEEKIMDKVGSKAMAKFLDPAKTMFRMLKAYSNGSYKKVPFGKIIVIVLSLAYVFSPIDIVPDFIPIAGLLDDATVLGACVSSLKSILDEFKEWENSQKK